MADSIDDLETVPTFASIVDDLDPVAAECVEALAAESIDDLETVANFASIVDDLDPVAAELSEIVDCSDEPDDVEVIGVDGTELVITVSLRG